MMYDSHLIDRQIKVRGYDQFMTVEEAFIGANGETRYLVSYSKGEKRAIVVSPDDILAVDV